MPEVREPIIDRPGSSLTAHETKNCGTVLHSGNGPELEGRGIRWQSVNKYFRLQHPAGCRRNPAKSVRNAHQKFTVKFNRTKRGVYFVSGYSTWIHAPVTKFAECLWPRGLARAVTICAIEPSKGSARTGAMESASVVRRRHRAL